MVGKWRWDPLVESDRVVSRSCDDAAKAVEMEPMRDELW